LQPLFVCCVKTAQFIKKYTQIGKPEHVDYYL